MRPATLRRLLWLPPPGVVVLIADLMWLVRRWSGGLAFAGQGWRRRGSWHGPIPLCCPFIRSRRRTW